jgi:regulator of nucleoside diphosphate kinase
MTAFPLSPFERAHRAREAAPQETSENESIMNHTPIYIARDDYSKLRLLLTTSLHSGGNSALQKLRDELDRAAIIDPAAIPPDVVTLQATVQYEDLGTGELEEYTITFPDRASIEKKRLSILAPIGTALIGCRVGDIVKWSTPGGVRQLKVRRVTPRPPESAVLSGVPPSVTAFTGRGMAPV